MGCVSSSLLNQDEELRHIGIAGSGALGHHIVSLTSTTYGLLALDHPPLPSSQSLSVSSNSTYSPPPSTAIPEVINSWELMAGLDNNDSFRFNNNFNSYSCSNSKPPLTPKFFKAQGQGVEKENCDPNVRPPSRSRSWEREREKEVILYTTSLRGVRSTFQACNAVRSALHSLGYSFCERDISMDRGFRDELNRMLQDQDQDQTTWGWARAPPRLFIRGRYVGGAEEVLRMHEDGSLADLLHGLPQLNLKTQTGSGSELLCDGCGGFCFLPCFRCHGSCKLVSPNPNFHTYNCNYNGKVGRRTVVMRCPDCNENGLVLCPLCT